MHAMQNTTTSNGVALSDLKLLLAIASTGNLGGAAKQLGVDHSSAFKKLGALERRIGARLFDRSRNGYRPTPAGEAAIEAAKRISDELLTLERRVLGEDTRLSGVVRVTTTDTLLHVVFPMIAEFRAIEPGIVVEISVANAIYDLSRRDADIAIRPSAVVSEQLVARRVGTVASAVYARADAAWAGEFKSASDQAWVAPDASLSHASSARWIAAHVPLAQIVLRADSLIALMQAAKSGIGATVLPCYLGDSEPLLTRVTPVLEDAAVPLWLITHPDLRHVRRIAALTEFLSQRLQREAARFEGRPVA
ncbi:LysR family transcriptional regulator [Lysobacter auxotrophicus]|uniref:LysR family transcriptional regulator n=2 Tax=Lysobacter auxotrophicus TaxID=2992573 RepID=A0ABN6UP10_9GAMM|nr:LysR family transcriptional regulator [Lysobacter auxotrophicus]